MIQLQTFDASAQLTRLSGKISVTPSKNPETLILALRFFVGVWHRARLSHEPERVTGIGPASLVWKTSALPLSYTHIVLLNVHPEGVEPSYALALNQFPGHSGAGA